MWKAQVEAVAAELSGILNSNFLIDEVAFTPSAKPADVFGRDETEHPPRIVISRVIPNAFVLGGHKLAIAQNLLAPLYVHVSLKYERALASEVGSSSKSEDRVCFESVKSIDPLVLLPIMNGDHNSAWNGRKRRMNQCVMKLNRPELLRLIEVELRFSKTVLSRFPKSQVSWAHRRWVINFFLTSLEGAVSHKQLHKQLSDFFFEEKLAVERANNVRRLNYAAWSHRRHCSRSPDLQSAGLLSHSLVAREISWAATRAAKNVSDYCGLHYIQSLMRRMPGLTREAEMLFVVDLIEKFPGFEALWIYRRQLFAAALEKQKLFFQEATNTYSRDCGRFLRNSRRIEQNHDVVARETGCITLRSELSSTVRWVPKRIAKSSRAESRHSKQAHFAAAYRLWIISLATRSLAEYLKIAASGIAKAARTASADLATHLFCTPGLIGDVFIKHMEE